MLRTLLIENYAIIDRLEIEFGDGLNIITGETGAGKSILLGAVGLLLGGRPSSLDETKNVVVEAVFGVAGYGVEPFFEENDLDYTSEVILRRVVNPAGKSRAYINDIPVNLGTLKDLTSMLLDIHSQHQTMLLGNKSFQTRIVDSIAGHDVLLARYTDSYDALRKSDKELAEALSKAEKERAEYDFLRHQFEQLDTAKLVAGEQENLETTRDELSHAAEILENLAFASSTLNDDDTSVNPVLKNIISAMERIKDSYPHAVELSERLDSCYLELKDIAYDLALEQERIDVDPERLSFAEERLDTIYTLQQKFKVQSITELIELHDDFGRRLSHIENFDEYITEIRSKTDKLRAETVKLAAEITKNRTIAAPKIEKFVGDMLSGLGMPNARIEVTIIPSEELTKDGSDRIAFMFSANKTTLQPIDNVASGGEMSRLMLALKSLVAKHSKLPTIIFDEIDTGVSGEVAHKMGQIINDLSADIQVVNITHLPQVASKGSHHFHVSKDDTTRIRKLTSEERVVEIAKMLSGSNITSAAMEQAKELLK